jgi:predicted nuclease of restriction endonuclease-like (RecB) superfamily
MKTTRRDPLYARIRDILESARSTVARSVNSTQVVANWLIGREIVEEQQRGSERAGYGDRLLRQLAARLQAEYGPGYGLTNLKLVRSFYLIYGTLMFVEKGHALRGLSLRPESPGDQKAGCAPRRGMVLANTSGSQRREPWQPGQLHPDLSWTHYRILLRVEKAEARAFYEIEATQNNWSARELERQVNSLLYERLALSKDKKGLMRLARKGHEVNKPTDVIKDPLVLEFLGLPESPRLVESELEAALISNLQSFLLELGKGFAFVARQERITLDADHFYIDLVFYHTVLKCFVLIDLKVGKLTHQDLGQLQLYVNYYDRRRRTPGDQPTLGLILCTDKNDAVVKYTLGEGEKKNIFASRYRLLVPTEAELKAEIRRGLVALRWREND